MGYISPQSRHSGNPCDSDSAFQCGNYRNYGRECVSHFIKTSVLEAAVLQSIQTVSRYVLENEEEFISQLKALWSQQKSKQTGTGQQELEEAGKRVQELDSMIQNLYESSMKGLLPERQVQRMIQQYDEEQILLERRIGELQEQMKQEEVKKVETERFIALVKKYRDCGEVTDTMLYDSLQSSHEELAEQLVSVKEELKPMKEIRYWVGKVLTPEQAEVEKKPEPKHSVTEQMKYLKEQEKQTPEQKSPRQKQQNMEL